MTAADPQSPAAGLEREAAGLRARLEREPAAAEAWHRLGNVQKRLGRHAEAAASLREAARLAPEAAAVHLNLGVACLESGRTAEAVAGFRRAVALEPGRAEARNILGHALLVEGRCSEAADELRAALRLRPGYAAAHDNLGRVLKAQGRAEEAEDHHRAALASRPDSATHSNLLYTLNLLPGREPAEVAAEHRRWAAGHGRFPLWSAPGPAPGPRRLRVGYVSPDFAQHAVAFFFLPVLRAHDRDRFEVHCYSNVASPDAVTRRVRGLAEHWRDIARLDDEAAAALIRRDRIDVLVDLAGHTAGNRLRVFARRAAPVQATWIGYPNTTGLEQMDCRLTDATSDPPGATEAWHSERLVRLPGPFLCYGPPADAPPVAAPPSAGGGGVTFGCCNNLAKINPGVIRLWSRVLADTPGSRLLLKSRGLADPPTAGDVRARFAREGVAPERVLVDGEPRSVAGHLRLYRRIDIALDPFPYNGTTTTCEALLMGVPVVTLAGLAHAGRVGASLLGAVGRPEWIADSEDGYAARCRELARDPGRLASIRANLRRALLASPLCDSAGFTRGYEAALLGLNPAVR